MTTTKSMFEYAEETRQIEASCISCGSQDLMLQCYPHEGGYSVLEFKKKQWLYLHCMKCKYDTSIWKLGIKE